METNEAVVEAVREIPGRGRSDFVEETLLAAGAGSFSRPRGGTASGAVWGRPAVAGAGGCRGWPQCGGR